MTAVHRVRGHDGGIKGWIRVLATGLIEGDDISRTFECVGLGRGGGIVANGNIPMIS